MYHFLTSLKLFTCLHPLTRAPHGLVGWRRMTFQTIFNWLTFLVKRALHFATKLNSRDIKKCNCFGALS